MQWELGRINEAEKSFTSALTHVRAAFAGTNPLITEFSGPFPEDSLVRLCTRRSPRNLLVHHSLLARALYNLAVLLLRERPVQMLDGS